MKKWILIFFWICCCFSFYSLWMEEQPLSKKMEAQTPRLILESFEFIEYGEGIEKKKIIQGDYGYLFEPNKLDIIGSSKAFIQDHWIHSDKSTLLFGSKSMKEFLDGQSELVSWEFTGHVLLKRKDWILQTEKALYDKKEDCLKSDSESLLKEKSMDIFGKNGFLFFLKTETLTMPGFIKGHIY